MDERKSKIRDLEAKKRNDLSARNRLLEELGEALFRRIGDEEPFASKDKDTPGALLGEYRKFLDEINDSLDLIKSLEKEVAHLKELEEVISARETEKSALEEELTEAYAATGKTLYEDPDFHDAAKQHTEGLIAKINEQEIKLDELEKREGGVIAWLGKSAQITVLKAFLTKDRSALKRLYRAAGENYFSSNVEANDRIEDSEEIQELRERLSSLNADLSGYKNERKNIGDSFGAEGSPSRRIHGLEKHIVSTREKFSSVYLRMGFLAAEEGGREVLAAILNTEDEHHLENAGLLKSRIASCDLEIEKIKTAMSIDDEKAEVEKMRKAINGQKKKITEAEKEISDLEKQINDTEKHVEELQSFLDAGE